MRIATMYYPATCYSANGRRKPHRVQAKMVCAHGDDKQYHSKQLTHASDTPGIDAHRAAAIALLDKLGINATVRQGKDYAAALGWDVATTPHKT